MKDYPEAQDILQTLGRKRLMEVRCVNKKHAKMQSDKEAAERAEREGESASKRIVDKLRSDVKGIRNVLKKTRYDTRSRNANTLLLHPFKHCRAPTTNTHPSLLPLPDYGDLCTDQSFHHRTNRRSNESIELQPLHLTSSSGIKTPKGVLRRMPRVRSDEMTNDDFRQPSVDKSPSPIGAGLPLLQRLKMLKEKQVKEH